MALPAYVLEVEGMGSERRARGFRSGDFGHGRGCGRWSATAAMVAVPGARGELCLSYDSDRCGLGEVKEGVGLLTVEAIEL